MVEGVQEASWNRVEFVLSRILARRFDGIGIISDKRHGLNLQSVGQRGRIYVVTTDHLLLPWVIGAICVLDTFLQFKRSQRLILIKINISQRLIFIKINISQVMVNGSQKSAQSISINPLVMMMTMMVMMMMKNSPVLLLQCL